MNSHPADRERLAQWREQINWSIFLNLSVKVH